MTKLWSSYLIQISIRFLKISLHKFLPPDLNWFTEGFQHHRLDHTKLIEKMKFIGFSNNVKKWFERYLSKRMFSVHVENSFSDEALIIYGVPKGSILGPLLFLLYVIDMVHAVNWDLLLYANGTGLIFQHQDVNVIEKQLNRNFPNICHWFVDNKLSTHFGEDKTKSILFAPLNKCKKLCKVNISYDSLKVKQYLEVTCLGCILDEYLSGESMALNVVSKIKKRLIFLYLKNHFLSLQLWRLLCYALIQPHFDYPCSVWYPNLNNILKTKLQTLQKKYVRFCLQLDNKAHVGITEFKQINWLPVNSLIINISCTWRTSLISYA